MSKKWAYCFAVIFILILRFAVLTYDLDTLLTNLHYEQTAQFFAALKHSSAFQEFVGSWSMPVFVATVIIFWLSTEDEGAIPIQFLILPVAYIPFSIIGATLVNAEFRVNYFWIHPLIIFTFGYFYVSMWTILIWLLEKFRLLS